MKLDSSDHVDIVHVVTLITVVFKTKELAVTLHFRKKIHLQYAQKCTDARKTPLNVTEALKGLGDTGTRKPKLRSR